MADPQMCAQLTTWARRLRVEIVKMIAHAGSGHPGGSLSAADLVAALYWHFMRLRPEEPRWPDRDRFVLCKGHACPVIYAALALRGFYPVEELQTLRAFNSRLQGHPDMKKTPGLDMTTGSLGQGLSAAVGMALGARLQQKDFRVFALLSSGDQDEGQTWEAAMAAGHYKLDHLVALLDYNCLQLDGWTHEVMELEPLKDKWRAFNWEVLEIDGHNMDQIVNGIEAATHVKGKPTAVLAHTIKGKGVSFMENVCEWHGRAPNAEELAAALRELEGPPV